MLKRVFDIAMQRCSNCGGGLKIIAAILEQPVIEKILTHPRLDPQPPPRGRAPGFGRLLAAVGRAEHARLPRRRPRSPGR